MMAQDTIEVPKVLLSKKALINGKSSEYKMRFWKIFKEELSVFLPSLDRNFVVLTELFTSDHTHIIEILYFK